MKINNCLLIFFSLVILFSCSSSPNWIKTDENIQMWLSSTDSFTTYSWQGEIFDSVANGFGILETNKNGKKTKQILNMFYGVADTSEIATLDDGSRYIGNIENDMMTGFGVLLKNDDVFIGNFENSKPNGYLKWYKNNTLVYRGFWKDGLFDGEGCYNKDNTVKSGIWKLGTLDTVRYCKISLPLGEYDGQVLDGKADGYGKMTYKQGYIYEGNWHKAKWENYGVLSFNGDSISGNWKEGKLNGDGLYKSKELVYKGEFLNNFPDGRGEMFLFEHDSVKLEYKGEWSQGMFFGCGELSLSNGDKYIGDFHENRCHGIGTYFYKSGEVYDGQWTNGVRDGYGSYKSNEFEYIGEWKDHEISGFGKVIFKNNDYYEGEFENNTFNGRGYFVHDKNEYEGEFVNGQFNGIGKYKMANEDFYEGCFKDGKFYGDGTLTLNTKKIRITANWKGDLKSTKRASILYANGDLYEGEISNGRPTSNGIWTTAKERKWGLDIVYKKINKSRNLYKNHEKEILETAEKTEMFLSAVEISTAVIGYGLTFVPGCQVAAGVFLGISGIAGISNNIVFAAGESAQIVECGMEIRDSIILNGNVYVPLIKFGQKILKDAIIVVIPKVLKKSITSLSPSTVAQVLSPATSKTFIGSSSIKINDKRCFAKIVRVVEEGEGKYVKKMVGFSNKLECNILHRKIIKSPLIEEWKRIKSKGPIVLTEKELEELLKNPDYIRQFIRVKSGSNFQDFFVRMSDSPKGKEQIKCLMENY